MVKRLSVLRFLIILFVGMILVLFVSWFSKFMLIRYLKLLRLELGDMLFLRKKLMFFFKSVISLLMFGDLFVILLLIFYLL